MVSKSGLKEFYQIYKKEFGIELEEKELVKKASSLLNLYKAVFSSETINIKHDHGKKIQSKEN